MKLQSLPEQYESLQHIFTHQSIATFVLDEQHKVVFWNHACEKLTGLKAEQMMGSNEVWRGFSDRARPSLADLMVDNQLAEAHEYFSKLRPSGKTPDSWHAEGWSNLPNGRQRYLVSNAHPVLDDSGRRVAVVETLEDITEYIKLPEGLEGGGANCRPLLTIHQPVSGCSGRMAGCALRTGRSVPHWVFLRSTC